MKKKRTLRFNVYLDRSGSIKLRKGKYRLGDGELRVGVTLYVPEQFFRPASLEVEQSYIFKDEDLEPLEAKIS